MKYSFSRPGCTSCSSLLRVGTFPCETCYCDGFKEKKKKRFSKNGESKRNPPKWCPRLISPPACNILTFVSEVAAFTEQVMTRDALMKGQKHIFPSAYHYKYDRSYPLGKTAKQFFDEIQSNPMAEVLPDIQIALGEMLEIDDGLKPYHFYYLGGGSFVPVTIFDTSRISRPEPKKGHSKEGSYA